jgi:hypothetical protein
MKDRRFYREEAGLGANAMTRWQALKSLHAAQSGESFSTSAGFT